MVTSIVLLFLISFGLVYLSSNDQLGDISSIFANDSINGLLLQNHLVASLNQHLLDNSGSPAIENNILKWIERKYMVFSVSGDGEAIYLGESAGIFLIEPWNNLEEVNFLICTPKEYHNFLHSSPSTLTYLEVRVDVDNPRHLWHLYRNLLYAPEPLEFTAVRVRWDKNRKEAVLRVLFDVVSVSLDLFKSDCFGQIQISFDHSVCDASVSESIVIKQLVESDESSWMVSIWLGDDRRICPLHNSQSHLVSSLLSFGLQKYVNLDAKQLTIHKVKFADALLSLRMYKLVGKLNILQEYLVTYLKLADYGDVNLFKTAVLNVDCMSAISLRPNREAGIEGQNELLIFYENTDTTYAGNLHNFVMSTYKFEKDYKRGADIPPPLTEKIAVLISIPPLPRKILPDSLEFFSNPRLLTKRLSAYQDEKKKDHTFHLSYGFQSEMQKVEETMNGLKSRTKLALAVVFKDEEGSNILFSRLFFMSLYHILRPGAFAFSHQLADIEFETTASETYYYSWQTFSPFDNLEMFCLLYDAFFTFLRTVGISRKDRTVAYIGCRETEQAFNINFSEPAQSVYAAVQKQILAQKFANNLVQNAIYGTASQGRRRIISKNDDTNVSSCSTKKDLSKSKISHNVNKEKTAKSFDSEKSTTKSFDITEKSTTKSFDTEKSTTKSFDSEKSISELSSQRVESNLIHIDWERLNSWIGFKLCSNETYFISLMTTNSGTSKFSLVAHLLHRGSRNFSPNNLKNISSFAQVPSDTYFLAISLSKFDPCNMNLDRWKSLTLIVPKKSNEEISGVLGQLAKLLCQDTSRYSAPLWIGVRSDKVSDKWSIILGFDPASDLISLYNYLIA